MGFNLKISAHEEKNSFILKDCTSYGGVFKIDDVTDSFVEIQPPSASGPYPVKINILLKLPNKVDQEYEVFPYSFGEQEIESGEWKFKYTVTFKNGQTKTAYYSDIFIKSVECCIDKHSPSLNGNAFKDDKQKLIIELNNLLEDVKRMKKKGLNGEANKTIEYMKSHCKCCGC